MDKIKRNCKSIEYDGDRYLLAKDVELLLADIKINDNKFMNEVKSTIDKQTKIITVKTYELNLVYSQIRKHGGEVLKALFKDRIKEQGNG